MMIKAPIELKCCRDMFPSWEGFYHRIAGNYQLMQSGIDPQELFHLMAVMPEVYLGEGGMASLVNHTEVRNIREINLEIVSNLMNRIGLTENVSLTYQDRAYITNVLKRLGVEDVGRFMERVSERKRENRLVEKLINLYGEHEKELLRMVEMHCRRGQKKERTEEWFREDRRLYLHEKIMDRLKTGTVYGTLQNFYCMYNGWQSSMSFQEFQAAEQRRAAAQILLNRMKGRMQMGKVPFIYRHENGYETAEPSDGLMSPGDVKERITSAVLLNVIDNLHVSRFAQQQKNRVWVHMENALYRAGDNTLWRMRNKTEDYSSMRNGVKLSDSYWRQAYEQEIQAIYGLLKLRQEEQREFLAEENFPAASLNRENRADGYGRKYRIETQETGHENDGKKYPVEEAEKKEGVFELESGAAELAEQRRMRIDRQIETYFQVVRAQWAAADFAVQPIFYGQEPELFVQGLFYGQEPESRGKEEPELFVQDLSNGQEPEGQGKGEARQQWAGQQDDIRRHMAVRKLTEEWAGGVLEKRTADWEQTWFQDWILTDNYKSILERPLESQEESWQTEGRREPGNGTPEEEHGAGQEFSYREENQEQLKQQLREINRKNQENFSRFQEILRQEEQKRENGTSAERMRQESLKALENPEQFLMEYRREEAEGEQKGAADLQRILSLLPEETRTIYEQLEQYLNVREQSGLQSEAARNNIELLLRDIRQAESGRFTEGKGFAEKAEHEDNLMRLIHRSAENHIDEELLQQLLQQGKLSGRNIYAAEHKQETRQTGQPLSQTLIKNLHAPGIERTGAHENPAGAFGISEFMPPISGGTFTVNAENLREQIRKGMQQQMGVISEQVYNRLERRLENEKRRRGY